LIVYIDPPFDYRDGMEEIYEKSFDMVKEIENDNIYMICFEHASTVEVPDVLGKFEQYKSKKFGKTTLTYFRIA
jgi:16S rRNA G966 N2-methylase RsmD